MIIRNRYFTDLKDLSPLLLALLVDEDLLPDELVHNVGNVGQQEGQDHRHG